MRVESRHGPSAIRLPVDLSVIVCTYNRCRLLDGSLQALAGQVAPESLSWEVVVVDNNCTDATASIVQQAQTKFSVPLRRVVEKKQGLSNARNCGITATRGRYLVFTDDDIRPSPDWVEAIWQTFKQEHCDGVAGPVELDWPLARPTWLIDELLSSLAYANYGPVMRALTVNHEPPLGANMAFARTVFNRVGNFDPTLGRIGKKLLGGEETELFDRILRAGFKVLYQPRAVVHHAVEPERVRKGYFRKLYYYGGQVHGRRDDMKHVRCLFGIPLFGIRQLFFSGCKFLADAWRDEIDLAFKQELNVWWYWGFLTGCYMTRQSQTR